MSDTNTYKVGDKLVNFGQVHTVFQIKEEILYYKPHFEDESSGGLTCSIPVSKLIESDIRPPLSKKDCKEMCKMIVEEIRIKEYMDANDMSILYNTNTPENLIKVLRLLVQESKDKENGLSTSKKSIFDKALSSFVQEYAYANESSIQEAETLLNKMLKLH